MFHYMAVIVWLFVKSITLIIIPELEWKIIFGGKDEYIWVHTLSFPTDILKEVEFEYPSGI